MIVLKPVGVEATALVQECLDAAPTYSINVDGIARDPEGARETLSTLPPGCGPESKQVLLILAGTNGKVVGVVDLIRGYPDGETAFIGLFLLREDSQGRGWGWQAYGLLERHVRHVLGCRKVRLAVVDSNPVIPFWEKLGFALTGESKPHQGASGNKSVKRVMQKELMREELM